MNLKMDPGQEILRLLPPETTIEYAVPFDIHENRFISDGWIIVSPERLYVVRKSGILEAHELSSFSRIRVNAEAHSGILEGKKNGTWIYLASFSMRHIIRVSYAAAGAEKLALKQPGKVVSHERELYCPKCGRAYQGAEKCPHCSSQFYYLRQFFGMMKGQWKTLVIIALCTMSVAGLIAWWPKLQQELVDGALSHPETGGMGDLIRFLILMTVSTVVMIALDSTQYYLSVRMGADIGRSLRERMYHKLQLLGMDFIHRRKAGEIMNRIQGDTNRILEFMSEVFAGMFSTLVVMLTVFTLMIIMNPLLTLFSFLSIATVTVIMGLFFGHIHRIFNAQYRKEDALESRLQDVLSGMKVVKSYGQEEKEAEAFRKEADEFRKIQTRNERFFAILYPLITFLMALGTFFAIYFGGRDVLFGRMSPGELLQYTTYTSLIFGPLAWMTGLPRKIMELITAMNRISDILEEEPTMKRAEHPVKKEVQGEIKVEHVTFGYEAYEHVLEDVSFELKRGEMLGLVGESGAGKTTLINLIMRLYDVSEGKITVDGVDLRDWDPETYHSSIGVVLQENFLFSGTILQNLRFAKPDAALPEIITACKAANAHDFICKLPDGYDTYVGEKGSTLSGGERQRISIARALLADPRILILDEATASLDTESEYQIQQAIERLIENRTTIAIAHRLSTLKNATKLIVIDSKKIAEMGTHAELLEKKGIYYNLVEAQLKMQADRPAEAGE